MLWVIKFRGVLLYSNSNWNSKYLLWSNICARSCFYNFNNYPNCLGILFMSLFSRFAEELRCCISNKLPGDAYVSGPQSILCLASLYITLEKWVFYLYLEAFSLIFFLATWVNSCFIASRHGQNSGSIQEWMLSRSFINKPKIWQIRSCII